jgi:hypothetical protein
MTHTLTNGERTTEVVCDRCADLYARPDKDTVLESLITGDTPPLTSLAAEDVMPGTLTWQVHPDDQWAWTLASTTTLRARDGELWVRWTYQNCHTRTFRRGQQVLGHFQPGITDYPGAPHPEPAKAEAGRDTRS